MKIQKPRVFVSDTPITLFTVESVWGQKSKMAAILGSIWQYIHIYEIVNNSHFKANMTWYASVSQQCLFHKRVCFMNID